MLGRVYPERTTPTLGEDWLRAVGEGEEVKHAVPEQEPAFQLYRQVLEESMRGA